MARSRSGARVDQDALGMPNPPKFGGISTNIRNLASPHWRRWTNRRTVVSCRPRAFRNTTTRPSESLKSPDGSPHPMAGKKDVVCSRSPVTALFAFAGIWTRGKARVAQKANPIGRTSRLWFSDCSPQYRGACSTPKATPSFSRRR